MHRNKEHSCKTDYSLLPPRTIRPPVYASRISYGYIMDCDYTKASDINGMTQDQMNLFKECLQLASNIQESCEQLSGQPRCLGLLPYLFPSTDQKARQRLNGDVMKLQKSLESACKVFRVTAYESNLDMKYTAVNGSHGSYFDFIEEVIKTYEMFHATRNGTHSTEMVPLYDSIVGFLSVLARKINDVCRPRLLLKLVDAHKRMAELEPDNKNSVELTLSLHEQLAILVDSSTMPCDVALGVVNDLLHTDSILGRSCLNTKSPVLTRVQKNLMVSAGRIVTLMIESAKRIGLEHKQLLQLTDAHECMVRLTPQNETSIELPLSFHGRLATLFDSSTMPCVVAHGILENLLHCDSILSKCCTKSPVLVDAHKKLSVSAFLLLRCNDLDCDAVERLCCDAVSKESAHDVKIMAPWLYDSILKLMSASVDNIVLEHEQRLLLRLAKTLKSIVNFVPRNENSMEFTLSLYAQLVNLLDSSALASDVAQGMLENLADTGCTLRKYCPKSPVLLEAWKKLSAYVFDKI